MLKFTFTRRTVDKYSVSLFSHRLYLYKVFGLFACLSSSSKTVTPVEALALADIFEGNCDSII